MNVLVVIAVAIIVVGVAAETISAARRGDRVQDGSKKARLTEPRDPASDGKAQRSFEWNAENVYSLKRADDRVAYLREKMRVARSERDPRVRHARFYACADLATEVKASRGISDEAAREVGEWKNEALDEIRSYP